MFDAFTSEAVTASLSRAKVRVTPVQPQTPGWTGVTALGGGTCVLKIFISWSGEPSRSVAITLRHWLPQIVQHVDPWMSDEEIASGTRWNDRIAAALEQRTSGSFV